jgi:hypothetical protein
MNSIPNGHESRFFTADRRGACRHVRSATERIGLYSEAPGPYDAWAITGLFASRFTRRRISENRIIGKFDE